MAPLNDDEKTSTTNWLRSHLAAIGSAAVISVYAAGYVRTSAAAARVAGDAPPRRRPVARMPIAPAEIAQQPTTRAPTDKKLVPAVTATNAAAAATAVTQPPTSAQLVAETADTSAGRSSKAGAPNAGAPKVEAAKADVAKAEAAKVPTTDAAVGATTNAPTAPTAPAAADTVPAQAAPKAPKTDSSAHVGLRDGVYAGWGTSRHGDIEATVEIKDGHIVSAMVTQCLTRYSCSWISALPPQVVERQSAEVDYVSGATESSNAFYGAVAQALGKAK